MGQSGRDRDYDKDAGYWNLIVSILFALFCCSSSSPSARGRIKE